MINLISFKCILITMAVHTTISCRHRGIFVHRAVSRSLAVHMANLCHWAVVKYLRRSDIVPSSCPSSPPCPLPSPSRGRAWRWNLLEHAPWPPRQNCLYLHNSEGNINRGAIICARRVPQKRRRVLDHEGGRGKAGIVAALDMARRPLIGSFWCPRAVRGPPGSV